MHDPIEQNCESFCREFFRVYPLPLFGKKRFHQLFHEAFRLGAEWGIRRTKQVYADDFGIHAEKYGTKKRDEKEVD